MKCFTVHLFIELYQDKKIDKSDESAVAKDEDILEISKRLLAQNKEAYEVLAK